jgi:hypothetical protein
MTGHLNSRSLLAAGVALTIAGLIAWAATTLSTPPLRQGAVEVTQLPTPSDQPFTASDQRKAVVLVTQLAQ